MLHDPPPAVHALLRVADLDALVWESHRPRWARAALQRAPWTVVRRVAPRLGLCPVGVRGSLRSQRSAAWLPHCAIRECVTPQMLVATQAWRQHPRSASTPAVAVLEEVAAILSAHGFAGGWGPGGSVGFELASGVMATKAGSDLDIVLSAPEPVALSDAKRLLEDLSKLPVRIDLLLETPRGAAVLAEYAKGAEATLLRCAQGPQLVRDPWSSEHSTVGTG
jgi:phosphoribosyl-dephospho-CoA transferase